MLEAEVVENRSRPYAKQAVVVAFLVTVAAILIFYLEPLRSLRVPMAYFLPLALIYGIGLAVILYRKGPSDLPIALFLAGAAFIGGGAALDGIATLIKTPTLDREANPIARALLDAGQPVDFVITYGVVAQLLLALLTCMLWAAFLRHRKVLIASARNKSPKPMLHFVKAALGAAHLTWRQYFVPLRLSDLPTAYHSVWAMTAVLAAGNLYRWYLGLKWFGVFPGSSSITALVTSFLLAIAIYLLWLAVEYSKNPSEKAAAQSKIGERPTTR